AAVAAGDRFYAPRPLRARLAADGPPHERSAAAGRVREALAEGPHSLHWEAYEPETPELRAAHCELRTPTGADAHRQAFRALLGSGRPVAVGIALDHFHDADGLTRFGLDDGDDAPRVLAIARALLTQDDAARHEGTRDDDARQEVTRDDDARREAAWASALGIVQELGEPGDAPAIVAALHPGTPPAIITRAVRAASWCLYRWQSADAELIAALRRVNADETLTEDLRAEAAEALSDL
ncbi:hypothetical protein, partial [Nonomuraea sp. NPDC050643]|uniref:hypothetical protein n=1 Tax=Nonomuraea sp. NPDC050643 TaxID=3155660 RepID=UPI0033EC1455